MVDATDHPNVPMIPDCWVGACVPKAAFAEKVLNLAGREVLTQRVGTAREITPSSRGLFKRAVPGLPLRLGCLAGTRQGRRFPGQAGRISGRGEPAASLCRDAHARDADPWVVRDEDGRTDRALCGAGRRGVSGFLDVRHGVLVWQGGL